MRRPFTVIAVAAVTALAATSLAALPTAGAAADPEPSLTKAVRRQLAAGVQAAPKASGAAARSATRPPGVNPYLGNVPDPSAVDYSAWRKYVEAGAGAARSARDAHAARSTDPTTVSNRLRAAKPPLVFAEVEPSDVLGANDTFDTAELVPKLGTGRRDNPRSVVRGTLAAEPAGSVNATTFAEDDGAIPLANDTGVGSGFDAMTTSAQIGDGLHGSTAGGTGDFDFYQVTAKKGQTITGRTTVSGLDSVVFVYSPTGEILGANDDGEGQGLGSLLTFQAPADGTYLVMVSGFGFGTTTPADPFDPASGAGVGREGTYDLEIRVGNDDHDVFAVDLQPGDVLGTSLGGAAQRVQVSRTDRSEAIGSEQDLSFLYPVSSPLPGGGNAVAAYVASRSGRHYVTVSGGTGAYSAEVEVYRSGLETAGRRAVQTIFLDFDGARVQTSVFGGPGVRTLSPLSSFIGGWGLPARDEAALTDAVVAGVEENLRADLVASGLNRRFDVRILNSKDDPDPYGKPNVSRIVVGGSIAESGIGTIGIASSIDPGNFGHQDDALVLLDLLSAPAGDPNSINTFVGPQTADVIDAVGQGVANITSHEAGHYLGSYHTLQFNPQANLMDQGGALANIIGTGPDEVLGTGDDVDVDFGEDVFVPTEQLTGVENTLTNTEFGLSRGRP
jgi:hypothetical protein